MNPISRAHRAPHFLVCSAMNSARGSHRVRAEPARRHVHPSRQSSPPEVRAEIDWRRAILDHRGRRTGECQAHPRAERQRRAPAVRRQFQLVRFGERSDPSTLGRSTADGQVRLHYVDRVDPIRSWKSNRVNSLSPAAIAIVVEDRTAAAPRRSSALTGSSNHLTSNGSTPAAKNSFRLGRV